MLQISEKIKELLKNGLPKNVIKEYYLGTPAETDKIIMPCIVIDTRGVDITLGPTGMDHLEYRGYVRVYVNKKDGLMNQHSKGYPSPAQKADEIIFGLDFSNNRARYSADSVIGILRGHPFLSGDTLNTQSTEVVYNTDVSCDRIDDDKSDVYIFEIRFNGKMNVEVLTRS